MSRSDAFFLLMWPEFIGNGCLEPRFRIYYSNIVLLSKLKLIRFSLSWWRPLREQKKVHDKVESRRKCRLFDGNHPISNQWVYISSVSYTAGGIHQLQHVLKIFHFSTKQHQSTGLLYYTPIYSTTYHASFSRRFYPKRHTAISDPCR